MTSPHPSHSDNFRKTTQLLMPAEHVPPPPGVYDIYPGFPIIGGSIQLGFDALAARIAQESTVTIDGFVGVFWEDLREKLDQSLRRAGIEAAWVNAHDAMRDSTAITHLTQPFLGGDDPLFGTRFTGRLEDFFDHHKLSALKPSPRHSLRIMYGCGAALACWTGLLVYVDVPKNEVQFRSRAGVVCNLGESHPIPPKEQYKRFYFVDWAALNRHRARILADIGVIVDAQRPDEPVFTEGKTLRSTLAQMARNMFRARPWFEPGPWGGQWILDKIPGLARDVPNYAWSFELIMPENGLILTDGRRMLEVSSDFLMFQEHRAVLGNCADCFGFEFPIRFDFLDTIGGGNLSIQCHPRPEYIRREFGETFTQDEAYYILDRVPGAHVYLGFQTGIHPMEFRHALEHSHNEGITIDIPRFVNVEKAKKHDFFLIPGGTIHACGSGNLVLEISATPYIFTFKMYDWLRLDLDGRPRPLNIRRAFENLHFDRQGGVVKREHVSVPRLIDEGANWQLFHLPTHRMEFYDAHRFEFRGSVEARTNGSPHVMSLVEGKTVVLETANGMRQRFNYAETFVVPAAAGSYKLISVNEQPVKVLKVFVKDVYTI
ncbi:MAG: class I mannose-6-phosphate isomerase [Candidatus Sumerlaeota bacterium]|nr:class I mannose-6-phosphate isomerase [Candidatus Sumerlaeota bacterium]